MSDFYAELAGAPRNASMCEMNLIQARSQARAGHWLRSLSDLQHAVFWLILWLAPLPGDGDQT